MIHHSEMSQEQAQDAERFGRLQELHDTLNTVSNHLNDIDKGYINLIDDVANLDTAVVAVLALMSEINREIGRMEEVAEYKQRKRLSR